MWPTDAILIERSHQYKSEPLRRELGRLMAVLIIVALAVRIWQVRTGDMAASVSHDPTVFPSPQATASTLAQSQITSVELRWMIDCDPTNGRYELGVYGQDAADCQPSARISVTYLQTALVARGILVWTEYLTPVANADNLGCLAEIREITSNAVVGALCQAGATLHRLDGNGLDQGIALEVWAAN
jgi:hypothetical protein